MTMKITKHTVHFYILYLNNPLTSIPVISYYSLQLKWNIRVEIVDSVSSE